MDLLGLHICHVLAKSTFLGPQIPPSYLSIPFLATMFTCEPFRPSWELSEASAVICWEGSVTNEAGKAQP